MTEDLSKVELPTTKQQLAFVYQIRASIKSNGKFFVTKDNEKMIDSIIVNLIACRNQDFANIAVTNQEKNSDHFTHGSPAPSKSIL